MLPFLSQPAVATACYVPRAGSEIAAAQLFRGAQLLRRTQVAGNRKLFTIACWASPNAVGQRLAGAAYEPVPGSTSLRDEIWAGPSITGFSAQGDAPRTKPDAHTTTKGAGYAAQVIAFDTAQPTAGDRLAVTVNGDRLANGINPDLNQEMEWGRVGRLTTIGGVSHAYPAILAYYTGLLAEWYVIDGAALPASVFGEFNIHGVWVPRPKAEIYAAIADAGGFGPNGCHLDFSDPLDPGKDVSGQGNHWTATGFDAGGADTVNSSPTNVYPTLNPLNKFASVAVSNGATTASFVGTSASYPFIGANMIFDAGAAAYEWQVAVDSMASGSVALGIVAAGKNLIAAADALGTVLYIAATGNKQVDGVGSAYGAAFGTGDKIKVRVAAGSVEFFKWVAGAWASQGVAISGLSGNWLPALYFDNTQAMSVDFGQFGFAPSTGFKALCTDNLPDPDIKDPAEAFTSEAATGANLPAVLDATTAHWGGSDYVEIVKRREAAEDWRWRFADDPANAWASNTAAAKAAAPALAAGGSYVGYRLRVGSKFGVYTAEVEHVNGAATTVTHGLATARNAVIATRVSVGGGDRFYRHPDLPAGKVFKLNSDAAAIVDATITNFGASAFDIAAAAPSGTYRVVVLAEVPGFISFGKFAHTASQDGPFIPADISPLWFHAKTDAAANQHDVFDAARNTENPANRVLWFNLPALEAVYTNPGNGDLVDFDFGGTKVRGYAGSLNYAPNTSYTLSIGRPIGGVCVAPATAR
jgi:hypothetical protein